MRARSTAGSATVPACCRSRPSRRRRAGGSTRRAWPPATASSPAASGVVEVLDADRDRAGRPRRRRGPDGPSGTPRSRARPPSDRRRPTGSRQDGSFETPLGRSFAGSRFGRYPSLGFMPGRSLLAHERRRSLASLFRPGRAGPCTRQASIGPASAMPRPLRAILSGAATSPEAAGRDRYTPAQKALHWTMAAIIVLMVPAGISMANILPEGAPLTNTVYELHKSFGLIIFTLALIRIAVRWRNGAPPLVPGLPAWQRAAARVSHYALYILVVLVPLAGWTATSVCCAPVKMFWTIPVTLPLIGAAWRPRSRSSSCRRPRLHADRDRAGPCRRRPAPPFRAARPDAAADVAGRRTEPLGKARRSWWPIVQAEAGAAGREPAATVASATRPVSRTAAAAPSARSADRGRHRRRRAARGFRRCAPGSPA